MNYVLKNKAFQKVLDDLSDGDFSKCLNSIDDSLHDDGIYYIHFGETVPELRSKWPRFCVAVHTNEIISVEDYKPHRWNYTESTTPPTDVVMRVQLEDGTRLAATYKHFEDGDRWVSESRWFGNGDSPLPESSMLSVKRFRPWDDD